MGALLIVFFGTGFGIVVASQLLSGITEFASAGFAARLGVWGPTKLGLIYGTSIGALWALLLYVGLVLGSGSAIPPTMFWFGFGGTTIVGSLLGALTGTMVGVVRTFGTEMWCEGCSRRVKHFFRYCELEPTSGDWEYYDRYKVTCCLRCSGIVSRMRVESGYLFGQTDPFFGPVKEKLLGEFTKRTRLRPKTLQPPSRA